MSPLLEKEPIFSAESAQLLEQFDRSIRKRILSTLEEQMRVAKRSQITDADVIAAVRAVAEQIAVELKGDK